MAPTSAAESPSKHRGHRRWLGRLRSTWLVGTALAGCAIILNLAGREDVSPELFSGSQFGPHFMAVVPRVEHGWPLTFARREGVSLYDAGWRDATRWNVLAGQSWFSIFRLLADVAICAVLVASLAAGWEVWRKRRRQSIFQFRVGDLLVLTTAAALLLAAQAHDRRCSDRDRALLVEADRDAGLTLNSATNVQRRARWEATEPSLLARLTGSRPPRVTGLDIEGSELPGLTGLSDLRALSIHRSVTPSELALLRRFTELEALDLCFVSYVARTSSSAEERISPLKLPALPWLRGLNLFGTHFFGDGLEHLPELEILELTQTKVGDDALAKIGRMPRLEVLALDHTRITSAGLKHLVGLPKLRSLSLRDCEIDDSAATYLTQMQALEVLDLRATSMDPDEATDVLAVMSTCKIQWPTKPMQSRPR